MVVPNNDTWSHTGPPYFSFFAVPDFSEIVAQAISIVSRTAGKRKSAQFSQGSRHAGVQAVLFFGARLKPRQKRGLVIEKQK
jgi:hypothetical protein